MEDSQPVQSSSSIIESDLPKVTAVLSDLKSNLNNATTCVQNLIEKVASGELDTDKGLSLLELKNHGFLSYLSNLSLVTLLKLSGIPLEDNPVVDRLVELRIMLERMRPIESKLKYQIEKYIKAATVDKTDVNDDANAKEVFDNIEDSSDSDEDNKSSTKKEDGEKLYKIPKVAQVAYPGEEERDSGRMEREKKRALNSTMLQDALYEHTEDPEVVYNTDTLRQKAVEKRQMIQRYEEDNFTRLQLSKKDRAALSGITTQGKLGSELLSFQSLDALHGKLTANPNSKKRKKSSSSKKGKKGFKKRRKH